MKRILPVYFILLHSFVFGQVIDDFSDGDFTNNPTWSGDEAFFIIENDTLRNNGPAASDIIFLSTPSAAINSATWEFLVKLDFAPSTSNQVKIYLVSDQSNLEGDLNGYFIEMGQSGDDAIKFRRQSGASSSTLFTGETIFTGNVLVRIKVTRNNAGNWAVFSDQSGESNFLSEGASFLDNTFSTSSYFGIVCKHTSTRKDLFFFDDFLITVASDIVAPKINTVHVISNTQLDIQFNETLNQATSETGSNYFVDAGIGQPTLIALDEVDKSLVHLTFSKTFTNNSNYGITVQNVEDVNGNAIDSEVEIFNFLIPEIAVNHDVVINEIMADPTPEVGLPVSEYVEIYNRSSKYIDLANYTLSDKQITSTSQIIGPNEYIILCESSDVNLFQSYGRVIGLTSWNVLTNGGELVTLKDLDNSLVIDELTYAKSWYKGEDKEEGGWSLELINPDHQCSGEDNWHASESNTGGTPGTINTVFDNTPDISGPVLLSAIALSADSLQLTFDERLDTAIFGLVSFTFDPTLAIDTITLQDDFQTVIITFMEVLQTTTTYNVSVASVWDCSGNVIATDQSRNFFIPSGAVYKDIVFNEIMADPSPEVGLPVSEYVEIYNRSSRYIDLANYTLSDKQITSTSQIIGPNEYIILCESSDVSLLQSFGEVIGLTSWNALTNGGEKITLKDVGNFHVIDELTYDKSWYKDEDKEEGGWSLELINPDHQCSDEDNWRASESAIGGTPGTINTVLDNTPDITGPTLLSAIALSADSLRLIFDERIDTTTFGLASFTFEPTIAVEAIVLQDDLQTVIITFMEELQTTTTYNVSVASVNDCSGNVITADQSINFFILSIAVYKDIIINEIMVDPTPEVGLPTSEWVELYNRSGQFIDLVGYTLNDKNIINVNYVLSPNANVILLPEDNISLFSSIGNVIGLDNWDVLINSGEEITLKNNLGNIVDAVVYDHSWYNSIYKVEGGWSLELIDPENICGEETNWSASINDNGGTPGDPNSVLASKPDLTGPKLISAIAITQDSLILKFDERLDTTTFQLARYDFEPELSVDHTVLSGNGRTVTIVLLSPIETSIAYQLTISLLQDCNGNLIRSENTKLFALSEEASIGDILINELLYNPITSEGDFVEVYNRSSKYINLNGWSVANGSSDSPVNQQLISKEHLLISPQHYLVFTKEAMIVASDYPKGVLENIAEVSSLPSFPNDGQGVVLLDANDIVFDYFPYDESMQHALLDDTKGVSLERISEDNPTEDRNNWHSAAKSVGYATPGYLNSQAFGSLVNVKNQVVISPEVFLPNQSGQNDFSTINYSFDQSGYVANVSIVDVGGRVIKRIAQNELLATQGFFQWNGTNENGGKARSGVYVVHFEVFNLSGNLQIIQKRVIVAPEL